MSKAPEDEAYWNLVDEFIQRANEACDDADPSAVSAALLQASARFSAFVVAASSLDRKEFTEEMDSSLQFLTTQYREHLRADLEDYRENYKVYIAKERPESDDD
ncbi:DUF3144 domain-containing protein [Marinimicrobium sp. ABcell2]|uniref:DUF3144 domain-containing protein n=1 Tax=Marinimicrobium sp. ABcell2 TaxID=3069751 RepID=UPI0027B6BD2D|nr:DUF3144 domain-containing protein [Marinimicrobium sp. ABcell2]MDQ2076818.1 DUF3144 domain-containing protein [Marinimicrobium sp. ABcell2]